MSRWALALLAASLLGWGVIGFAWTRTPFFQSIDPLEARLAASWRVGIADLGETPALTPRYPDDPIPYCTGLGDYEQTVLREGIGFLRATEDGSRLYDLIVAEGVCIGTRDLTFNSAYATARWSPGAQWSESEIIVGDYYVDWLYPDVLASILAHEATHIERAVSGTACYYVDACTTLPNGVELEEEIVAHEAEAKWWLDAYGTDGKDRAFAADAGQNRLKAAYLRGPADFRTFVRQLRSSEREGESL